MPRRAAAARADEPVDRIGLRYEAALAPDDRRAAGAYFTPRPIAEGLVRFAAGTAPDRLRVCDPAVGGGAFLLAAGRWLEAAGLDRATIVREHLWGADSDPGALAATEEALRRWSAETGSATSPGGHLVCGDSLADRPLAAVAPPDGFDLVVGNPPFLSQLGRRTAGTPAERAAWRARFGDVVGPYTDPAALFLLAALELARPGGRVTLVLPESFLGARDAAGARRRVLADAALEALWVAGEPVFGAQVDVCAPVLVRGGGRPPSVRRAVGASFAPAPPSPSPASADATIRDRGPTWSFLAVVDDGLPHVVFDAARTLGERCRATAGFRDEYYALASCVEEDPDGDRTGGPKLITSGLIDPGQCRWGTRAARFHRRPWRHPRVALDRLRPDHPRVARWAEDLLVPKVVLATQTRVVEAAVDLCGRWYPSTPTIAVVPPPEQLWSVAAVLLAPPVSVWARHRVAGTALARDAIKLAAADVAAVPLPTDLEAWDHGARLLEAAVREADGRPPELEAFARTMTHAYGAGDDVVTWWNERRPRPGRRPSA